MLELEVLIGELVRQNLPEVVRSVTHLVSVDGLSTGTVTLGEVSALSPAPSAIIVVDPRDHGLHEVLDDSVEAGSLVSESEILTIGGLSSAQCPEVLYGLGNGPGRSACFQLV